MARGCSQTPPRYNPDYSKFPRFAQAACGQATENERCRNTDLGCCTDCSGNCIPRCLADMLSRCFIWRTYIRCSLRTPGASILSSVLVAPYTSGWSCTLVRQLLSVTILVTSDPCGSRVIREAGKTRQLQRCSAFCVALSDRGS